jgi:glycosyltransferase involved in cell wall biosynthesis
LWGVGVGRSIAPQARALFRNIVNREFVSKSDLSKTRENIHVVVPSKWMESKVRASPIFKDHEISMIPNPISDDFLNPSSQAEARKMLGLGVDDVIGITISEQLDSPGKFVEETLETFFRATSGLNVKSRYLLVGSRGEGFERKFPGVINLGHLTPKDIAKFAPAANFAITMSSAESSGMTVAEARSMGILPIARKVGGLIEQIEQGKDGFLCDGLAELEITLSSISTDLARSQEMASLAQQDIRIQRTGKAIAQRYIGLYERL